MCIVAVIGNRSLALHVISNQKQSRSQYAPPTVPLAGVSKSNDVSVPFDKKAYQLCPFLCTVL